MIGTAEALAIGLFCGAVGVAVPWLTYLRGREHGRAQAGGDP